MRTLCKFTTEIQIFLKLLVSREMQALFRPLFLAGMHVTGTRTVRHNMSRVMEIEKGR